MTDINLFKIGDVYIITRLSDYAVVDILLPLVEWSMESGIPYTPDDLASALNGSYRNSSMVVTNLSNETNVTIKCKKIQL
jgi:hypothetical protein